MARHLFFNDQPDQSSPAQSPSSSSTATKSKPAPTVPLKRARTVNFTESDEEDARATKQQVHSAGASLDPLGARPSTGQGKNSQQEKHRRKEEAKRLEHGRKELPVYQGKLLSSLVHSLQLLA